MKKVNVLFLFLLLILQSCKQQVVDLPDGILIYPSQPSGNFSFVSLQAVTPSVIRVKAGYDPQIKDSSLIIVPLQQTQWTTVRSDSMVILKTNSINAAVHLKTGIVSFTDSVGNKLLQGEENGSDLKKEADGIYQVSQKFHSPADESFYGLGQPQTGVFNYKNRDVDLTQYNSIVAVPFLMSSKKYGILWDNYSITKFGDSISKKAIYELNAKDLSGNSGWLARYMDADGKTVYVQKNESDIGYTWLSSLQQIPEAFPMAKGKVEWQGTITADTTGIHKFFIWASGYTKCWIGDSLVHDRWREGWNPGPSYLEQWLKKGKEVLVRLEWIPESKQAFIDLKFLPPSEQMSDAVMFTSEAGKQIDYYFIYGNTPDAIISGYRDITGKAKLLPKWAFGFWQSRERYKTQEELESTVIKFRQKKIGLDNIVLDWSYWKEDGWGSHEFDTTRFPNAEGMIKKLHDSLNTRLMISVWPKFYEGIDNYNALNQNGYLYTQNIKDQQKDWIGKGYVSTFYDAFNPLARKMFWDQIQHNLWTKGVDAWWLDATEPDILSNASIEKRKQLMEPLALGSSTEYFNVYSLPHAAGVYEGQRSVDPDKRAFILSRSAFAGLQRYSAATWSGDISARFDELERQIPAGINFSMSGLPYWTSDIGGFFVENKYDRPDPTGSALEEWRELNTRWYQFGAFCPIFRSHGQYPYREIFNIAPESHPAYKSMLYYNQLRYRLLPYIYSIASQSYHDNYTIMRGLPMDFPSDPRVKSIGDQYMFGSSLLVSPVYRQHDTNRNVYLPEGQGWYDLYSGVFKEGGQTIQAPAPYERIPVYVKEGAIIPFGPQLEYTMQQKPEHITLYVYTGKDGAFTIYEDDGVSNDYERNKYSEIPILYNEAGKTLTIGKRKGSYGGMLQNRIFSIVWVTKDKAGSLDFSRKNDTAISYNGNEQTIKMNNNF